MRVAGACDVDPGRAREIIGQVRGAVGEWSRFARATDVAAATRRRIEDRISGA